MTFTLKLLNRCAPRSVELDASDCMRHYTPSMCSQNQDGKDRGNWGASLRTRWHNVQTISQKR
jgi:hypothetical protein